MRPDRAEREGGVVERGDPRSRWRLLGVCAPSCLSADAPEMDATTKPNLSDACVKSVFFLNRIEGDRDPPSTSSSAGPAPRADWSRDDSLDRKTWPCSRGPGVLRKSAEASVRVGVPGRGEGVFQRGEALAAWTTRSLCSRLRGVLPSCASCEEVQETRSTTEPCVSDSCAESVLFLSMPWFDTPEETGVDEGCRLCLAGLRSVVSAPRP